MTYRRTVLFAFLAASALAPLLFSQAKVQDFDPHDISGIWKNPEDSIPS
jgi:hypothetical protein